MFLQIAPACLHGIVARVTRAPRELQYVVRVLRNNAKIARGYTSVSRGFTRALCAMSRAKSHEYKACTRRKALAGINVAQL